MDERTVNFSINGVLGEKAQVTEEDGDLYIEGWAADITLDDQDEYFSYDALKAAADEFMAQPNRPLLYHHKPDMQLGEIITFEARQTAERAGIWMKARVDEPAPSHPILADVYRKVKRGTMKGLSVAGRFFGEPTPNGWRIGRASFRETSVTPFPVHPRTLATVVGKAVEEFDAEPDDTEDRRRAEAALTGLKGTVEVLGSVWEKLESRSAGAGD